MQLVLWSLSLFLSYFFFELEPEWEDPEDWPRRLKSHKTPWEEEQGQTAQQLTSGYAQGHKKLGHGKLWTYFCNLNPVIKAMKG